MKDTHIGNLARGERGETMVAFAVTLPILLSFLFGLMQVCMAFYTYEWISEAAREGTRYAMVHGATCESSTGISCTATATTGAGSFPSVDSFVSGIGLPNLGGGKMNVVTTYPDGDEVAPHRVMVSVTYTFPYKIPFNSSAPITLSSTSEMSILQ
ncbi:MAG: TadE/TadG family type IV pilus assembly protein [Terracidiphilus sp.]